MRKRYRIILCVLGLLILSSCGKEVFAEENIYTESEVIETETTETEVIIEELETESGHTAPLLTAAPAEQMSMEDLPFDPDVPEELI